MARTRRAVRRTLPPLNGDSLTASITIAQGRSIELGMAQQRPWQELAWNYWGRLGELMYPTTQLARLITQMDWDVTVDGRTLERTDDDTPDEVDDFLASVTDGVGQAEAIRLLALNIQVAAECWYVHTDDGWNVYSILDPTLRDIREHDDWVRLHVKIVDPRDQRYAIGPFSSVIGPAEELLTLEALSRSQSRSRIATAGILLRPQSAQFLPDTDGDGNEVESDPFGDDLMAAMTAPIADEHDPSALVPMDIEVPDDAIEKFRHLVFERPYDDKLHERVDRVIKRIATGLDIPAEVLLGLGEVNHWGQWLLSDEMKSNHALPLATRVGEVLAIAGEQAIDPERDEGWIQVTPDPAALFAKRSTVQDAFRGVDRGAVGLPYVRDAMGAKPEDAPTQDDLDIILALRGRTSAAADVIEPQAEEDAGPDVEPVTDEGPPDEQGTPIAAAIDVDAATEAELERFGDALAAIDMSLRDSLTGAMAIAVAAARSRVGAKVRTAIRSTPEHNVIEPVPNGDVAAKLGARAFELADVEATVRESFERDLMRWWRGRVQMAQQRIAALADVDVTQPGFAEAADASVATLIDGLTEWTVGQLTRTTAAQQEIPAGLAREVVAVAGGSARSG